MAEKICGVVSSLVAQIQRAILGSAGPETLHALLVELKIPAGQPWRDDALERLRHCLLYSGSSVEELRAAFADLSLSGHGPSDEVLAEVVDFLRGASASA